jgi:hypothetical protein
LTAISSMRSGTANAALLLGLPHPVRDDGAGERPSPGGRHGGDIRYEAASEAAGFPSNRGDFGCGDHGQHGLSLLCPRRAGAGRGLHSTASRTRSYIRSSLHSGHTSARTGSSRVQAAERNNFPVEHPADNHRARVRRQRLGRPEARSRQNLGSGRVRGTPGRSGVSAGLRAVNNAAEGTALAEFACC